MLTVKDIAAAADYPALLATARRSVSRIAARFTPARPIWLRPKPGGANAITSLMVQRELLIADLREARSKHHSTCDLIRRRNAMTLEILRRGA